MPENLSSNTPLYIQNLFSKTHPKELHEVKIQDRDVMYRIIFGKEGLQAIEATRDNIICAQISVTKPEKQQALNPESAYVKYHTDNGHVELNTGADGCVDSILTFIHSADKTVHGALTFDLLQQSFGVWSDSRWADFQLTNDGLRYVQYYTQEDGYQKKAQIPPQPSEKMPVVIDGEEKSAIWLQKKERKPRRTTPKEVTHKKEIEFLSIVAQLSPLKKNELLDKWKTEALQILATERQI